MGKRIFRILFFTVAVISAVISCTKFENFTDSADILSIEIYNIDPAGIGYVGKTIDNEAGELRIHLKGELDKLPIRFTPKFTTSAGSEVFREKDFETMEFSLLSDTIHMMVIAQSGLPKKWKVMLSDERNSTTQVKEMLLKSHTPAEVILKDPVFEIYSGLKEIGVGVEDGLDHFPLTIEADIRLTPNSFIVEEGQILAKAATALKFEFASVADTVKFMVQSESGEKDRWKVFIRTKESDAADILDFKVNDYIPSGSLDLSAIRLDRDNSQIILKVKDKVENPADFFLSISNPQITLSEGAVFGEEYKNELNFESLTQVARIPVISQDKKTRLWTVRLDYQLNEASYIETFRIISCQPSDVELLKDDILIDRTTSPNPSVQIKVNKGVNKFPATISASATASAGGTIANELNTLYFKDIDAKETISVRSVSGEVALWDIILRDVESARSGANDITSFQVKAVVPSGISLSATHIDASSHTITLPVASRPGEDAGKAISLEAELKISDEAFIVNNTNFSKEGDIYKGLFRFESLSSSNEIKIEAANGQTQIWKIILSYSAKTGNDIEVFSVKNSSPAQVLLGSFITLDKNTQSIEIKVSDGLEYFPLTINPELTLSANAKVISGLPLIFERVSDPAKIMVISETGQEKIWTVNLKDAVISKNGQNLITAFNVTGTIPQMATSVAIDQTAQTVTVTATGAAYPLIVSATPTLSDFAEVVLPLYSYRFESANQSYVISVKAQNGVIRDYKLVLNDGAPKSNAAEILTATPVSIMPALNGIGQVNIVSADSKVEVQMYEGASFPANLKMELTVSPDAETTNLNRDNIFHFESIATAVPVEVKAADGSVKRWLVVLKQIAQPAQKPELLLSALDRENMIDGVPQAVFEANSIQVHATAQTVAAGNLNLRFSQKVHYEKITTFAARRLGGIYALQYNENVQIPLTEFTSGTINIRVTNEQGAFCDYTVSLDNTLRTAGTQAEVIGFTVSQLRPFTAHQPQVTVNSAGREVVLKLDDTKDFVPFNFLAGISTSVNSTLSGINNGQTLSFDLPTSVMRFSVRSESGTVTNDWSIRIEHNPAAKNQQADVETFSVAKSLPFEINIASGATVDNSGKIVTVDVNNWVKNQTLYITPNITYSAGATSDLPSLLSFTNPNGSTSFKVTSESGLVQTWTIKLHFTAVVAADVTAFTVSSHTPESMVLGTPVTINTSLQQVVIPVVDKLSFPARVRAEMTVSEGAVALDAPVEYVFNNLDDIKTVQVEAADGMIKEWTVRLGYTFNNEAEVISMSAGAGPSQVTIGDINVNSSTQVIEMTINNWNGVNEFSFEPVFLLSDKATLEGISNSVSFTKKTKEQVQFYVVAEDKTTRKQWTIRLKYTEASTTNITSLTINTSTPAGVILVSECEIDNANGVVYLVVDKWNGNKEFTTKYTAVMQDFARTVSLPSSLTFNKGTKESYNFKVRAQDGNTERAWTLRLKYTEISAAKIVGFAIKSTNRESVVLAAAQIGDGVINMPVTQGVRDGFGSVYMVQATVTLEENGAQRTQDVTLRYNAVGDTPSFVVTDSYDVSKTWTVNLLNQASNQAVVTKMDGSAFTSSVADVAFIKQTQNGNHYKIYVSDIATKDKYGSDTRWPVVTMAADAVAISPLAASNVALNTLVFNVNSNQFVYHMRVTADDGVTYNDYVIEFVYCAQIENSNFSKWYMNGSNVWQIGESGKSSYWTTANLVTMGVKNEGTIPLNPGNSSGGGTNLNTRKVGAAGITKIAAGSLFIGKFTVPGGIPGSEDENLALTNFGVAFRGRPTKIRFSCSYNRSDDKGQIWMALNYTGNSRGKEGADGYAEQYFSSPSGMTSYELPINYKNNNPVTMITISFSSSYNGAKFEGAEGATLLIEGIELIYD